MEEKARDMQLQEIIYISSDESQEDTCEKEDQRILEMKKQNAIDIDNMETLMGDVHEREIPEEDDLEDKTSYRRILLKYQTKEKCFRLLSDNYHELLLKAYHKFSDAFPGPRRIQFLAQLFLHRSSTTVEIKDDTDVQKLVNGDSVELVLKADNSYISISSSLVRWFWWDDDNKWKVYKNDESAQLEQSFLSGETSVTFKTDYLIDFTNRTQTRVLTGKSRNIIRGIWFWKADSGYLVPYDEQVAAQLEQAYNDMQNKTGQKLVTIDTERYCVVQFKSVTQRTKTGTSVRQVVRGFV